MKTSISKEWFLAQCRERGISSLHEALGLLFEVRDNGVGFARTDEVRAWWASAEGRPFDRSQLSAKARARRG